MCKEHYGCTVAPLLFITATVKAQHALYLKQNKVWKVFIKNQKCMYGTMPGESWVEVGRIKKHFAAMVRYRAGQAVLCFILRYFSCAAFRYLGGVIGDDPRLSSESPVRARCGARSTTLFLGSFPVNMRRGP